jgi:phosphoglycerate dehydrogenase-like enzyme
MTKIVITNHQDFTDEQRQRLNALGDVTYHETLPTGEEYLQRIKGADIICSGTAGLQDIYAQLKDVYITVGFISVAFVDLSVLKKNNVTISNAPGANRYAVSEWIIGMMIIMARQLDILLNRKEGLRKDGKLPPLTPGLAQKSVTILGKGNVGSRVGEVATSLGMADTYFCRGDDLHASVKDADYVVNTLSVNSDTKDLLDAGFFAAMKKGSYFVDVARSEIVDTDAMLKALDEGQLSGVASDCGGILVGDTDDPLYQKLLNHPKVYATPHISYNTPLSMKIGNDIMIDNVEAWIKGQPQHVVTN